MKLRSKFTYEYKIPNKIPSPLEKVEDSPMIQPSSSAATDSLRSSSTSSGTTTTHCTYCALLKSNNYINHIQSIVNQLNLHTTTKKEKIPLFIELYKKIYENKKEILQSKHLSFIIVTVNKCKEFKQSLIETICEDIPKHEIYECYFMIDLVLHDFERFIHKFLG